jgi:hypothetical protein
MSTGRDNDRFGEVVSSAGDVNGDGYGDIAVNGYVFFGGASADRYYDIALSRLVISSIGDLNKDGFGDILTEGPEVYFGSATGENAADILRIGMTVLAAADMDGDGLKEVVVKDRDRNKVYIYSLAPYLALPEITVHSPKDHAVTDLPDITIQGEVKGAVTRLLVAGEDTSLGADGRFTATVSLLEGDNYLEIISETPEGKIAKRTLTVQYLPQVGPLSILITSPVDGETLSVSPVTVTGTVSDASAGVTVSGAVNVVNATVSGDTFTATGVYLREGDNTLTAFAMDRHGRSSSESVTVTFVRTGTISGAVTDSSTALPLSGVSVTITNSFGVDSTTTDENGAYTVSGVAHGSFTAAFEKSGFIKQTVNRTLAAGQTLNLDVQLTQVPPPPPLTVAITSPINGAVLTSSSLSVSGSVTAGAFVSVNGRQASVSSSTFSALIPLKEGSNTITATATDQYGQTASHSIAVTLTGLIDTQEIFADPLTKDFGETTAGTSKSFRINISNIGSGNLEIGVISKPLRPFLISSDNCSLQTLSDSHSCLVEVKFSPDREGTFTGTLMIPSNDGDNPLITVTLKGAATLYDGWYTLPDTGQKECYDGQGNIISCPYPHHSMAQDGSFLIYPPSYAFEGEGTIADNNTLLLWQQQDDGVARTWDDAVNYCADLSLGGHTEWRLPSKRELLSIVDYGRFNPAADPLFFTNTIASNYWSSSLAFSSAEVVNFGRGESFPLSKTSKGYVRCVQGEQLPVAHLVDNGDETMTDLTTGLMWTLPVDKLWDWASALNICNTFFPGYKGYQDWRMPNIKELASVQFSFSSWTSTTNPADPGQAFVSSGTAAASLSGKAVAGDYVRCVRNALSVKQSILTGTVSDSSTGLPVGSAIVTITDSLNKTKTASTDANGGFVIEDIAPGPFGALIMKTGYYSCNMEGKLLPGETKTMAVMLNPMPAQVFTAKSIGDYGSVAVMEVAGNYDALNPDGTINALPRQEIAKEFLSSHQDDYDFLVIFSNFGFAMPEAEAEGFYLQVKNDTLGIGQQFFDNSALFGSDGKLQGTIDMGNISTLVTDPSDPRFEDTLAVLSHEMAHRWASHVKFRDSGGNLSTALLGKDGTHWSFSLDSGGSVLYGNEWQDNGNGTFTSIAANKYYSPLDLYLMGLADSSQVAPMLLIDTPGIDPARLPEVGVTISGTARYITVDDIIAAEGPRVPDSSTAQKTFKVGFILITTPGTFTGSEPSKIENIRNAWAGRFSALAAGKGSIADVAPSITIYISSPLDGEAVSKPGVTVKGAIINTTGNETGVTVNGIPAAVYGNQFIASHVPLAEGSNTLTVTATDMAGNSATTSITVNAVTTGSYIRFTSDIESGIAPLEAILRIDGSFSITNSNMSVTGPAAIALIDNPGPDEYRIRMTAEGIYTFTANATGPDGNVYQDTVAIIVMNKAQLDKMLRAKWTSMTNALGIGDTATASSYISSAAGTSYQEMFNALAAQLSSIMATQTALNPVSIRNNVAKYELVTSENGKAYSYEIIFINDTNGLWMIWEF